MYEQADDKEGTGAIVWMGVGLIALVVAIAMTCCGCNDSDSRNTTINEAAPGSAQTNGIIIMQDGNGNVGAVYAETDGGIIPITIDQVGTGNIAIVEIVRTPVIEPEPAP